MSEQRRGRGAVLLLVHPCSFSALLWPIAWEKQWPACENAPRGGHCFSDGCGLMSNDFPVSSAQMPRGEGLRSCSGAALTGRLCPCWLRLLIGSASCWLHPCWPRPSWPRHTGSASLLAPPYWLHLPVGSTLLAPPPCWPRPSRPRPTGSASLWLRPHWLCLKGKSEGRLPGGRGSSALSCPHPF